MTNPDAARMIRLPKTHCWIDIDPAIHVWPRGNAGPCQCGRILERATEPPPSGISVTWGPVASPRPGDRAMIELASGTRIAGTVTEAEPDRIAVEANPLDPALIALLFPDERNPE